MWNRGRRDEADFWSPIVALVVEEGGEEGQREDEGQRPLVGGETF